MSGGGSPVGVGLSRSFTERRSLRWSRWWTLTLTCQPLLL